MRNAARRLAGVVVAGVALCFCGLSSAQPAPAPAPAPGTCRIPQSPRSLTAADWNQTSETPAVSQNTADSVSFMARDGRKLILHLCSQHYHCRIENVQTCEGEKATPAAGESACPARPPVGSWIEIHTVYHEGPTLNPLPEDLKSCRGTLVVLGYHAKVTAAPASSPIPVPFGPPAAEWSGSATNVDVPPPPAPPECKAAAFWHFALGCDFTLSQARIVDRFKHPDEARGLQPPNRLSRDLTHIVRPPKRR